MVTPQDSEPKNPQITPLSEEELAAISGGLVTVSFTLLLSEESSEFMTQEFLSGGHSQMTVSGCKRQSSFGLQFSGSFESMDQLSSFFTGFMKFFGLR